MSEENKDTTLNGSGSEEGSLTELIAGALGGEEAKLLGEVKPAGEAKGIGDKGKGKDSKSKAETEVEEEEEDADEEEVQEKQEQQEEEEEEEDDKDSTAKTSEDELADEFDIETLTDPKAKAYVESLQKGVTRLKDQREKARDDAEEQKDEVAKLKVQLEEAGKRPPVVTGAAIPLAHVTSEEDLKQAEAEAQATLAWAKKNRKGATLQIGGVDREFNEEQMEGIRENAQDILNAVPERRKWLADYQTAKDAAAKVYPDDKRDKSDAERRKVLLEALASLPDHELIIGDALVGAKVRKGLLVALPKNKPNGGKPNEQSAPGGGTKTKEAPKVKPAPSPLGKEKASNEKEVHKARLNAAHENALKTGSTTDIANALAAQFGE